MDTPTLRLVVGAAPNAPADELEALLAARVDEVFVGYVPGAWLARFGAELSPNRRHAVDRQFLDPAELARFGAAVRRAGAELSVTLNEHLWPPDAQDLLALIVGDALAAGARGFIIADLDLLSRVAAQVPPGTRLSLSNEAGAYSLEAARAYVAHGATRVVFPREMKPSEMASIASGLAADAAAAHRPPVELEAFVAREFCPNASSLCFATHGYGRLAHFCFAHDRQVLRAVPSGAALRELDRLPPGWSGGPELLAALALWHRCGLCAIGTLAAVGLRHLKIPGRSASALGAVRAVRALIDGGAFDEAACRAQVGAPEFCAAGHHCYYDLDDVRRTAARATSPTTPVARPAPAARTARPVSPPPGPELSPPARALSFALLPEACTPERAAAARLGLPSLRAALALSPWEEAAADRTAAALARHGWPIAGPPRRVILDLSACPHRWPRPAALLAQLHTLRDAGHAVAVALPPLFEADRRALAAGLDALAAEATPTAILANDLGAIALVAERGLPVEAGRLLDRRKRDQLALDPAALPAPLPARITDAPSPAALRQAQARAYAAPHHDRGTHARLLAAHGVRRLAWDALPTAPAAPPGPAFLASLWAPWSHLSHARACPLAIALDGASPAHPTERCSHACVHSALDLAFPYPHAATVRHGATACLDTSSALDATLAAAALAFDEVVVSLQVPR